MSNQYINEPSTRGKVCLVTSLGDVDIELWSKECPKACRNFVQLCMEGYYNKCLFHTVIKDIITQTGDPTGTGEGGESIYSRDFEVENHQRLRFTRRGLVAMAANPDGLMASQFFITLGPTPECNGKHTLFGKIANNTIFNILEINNKELDSQNRPVRPVTIKSVKILENPFDDITPRELSKKKDGKKKDKTKEKITANTALLSFSDVMEEEQQEPVKKPKSKSAHDILQDEKLSKAPAVNPEELGHYDDNEDDAKDSVQRVKDRLERRKKAKERRHHHDVDAQEEDPDFEDVMDEQGKAEKRAKLDALAAEARSLKKALKVKNDSKDVVETEENVSDNIKRYTKLKLSFSHTSKDVVKSDDAQREAQTTMLMKRFMSTLKKASVDTIVKNRKVDMTGEKSQAELLKDGAVVIPKKLPKDMLPPEELGQETGDIQGVQIVEDAVDDASDSWMKNAFVATSENAVTEGHQVQDE